ncbi:MAG: hypothetical protein ACXQTR_01810 [Candidatus Methanospirareceae archaeon]
MNYELIKKVTSEVIDMNGGDEFTYDVSVSFYDTYIIIACLIVDKKTGKGNHVQVSKDYENFIGRIIEASANMLEEREVIIEKRKAELEAELEKLVEASR